MVGIKLLVSIKKCEYLLETSNGGSRIGKNGSFKELHT